jgi:hypothetical protein
VYVRRKTGTMIHNLLKINEANEGEPSTCGKTRKRTLHKASLFYLYAHAR